jgi:DNA polymerase I-like protein with 3'-5' exonuclease and polymerase domains
MEESMVQDIPYIIVDDDNFDQTINHLSSISETLGFDTETNKDGTIHFIQIYSPVADQTFIFRGDDPKISKLTNNWGMWNVVGHNIQYDLSVCLKQYGSYPNPVADTFLIACSVQESEKGLKTLIKQYFGYTSKSWEELFGDFDYTMDDAKWHYVANDPYYTYALFEHYRNVGAYRFVKKVHEIDIKAMIHYMESSTRGILIDQGKFNEYLEQYTNQVDGLQTKLNEYAGWEVRTSATRDIKKLLFEQMGLPIPPITTETGEVSVSKEALSYIPDTDGIITLITQIKESKAILASMKNL